MELHGGISAVHLLTLGSCYRWAVSWQSDRLTSVCAGQWEMEAVLRGGEEGGLRVLQEPRLCGGGGGGRDAGVGDLMAAQLYLGLRSQMFSSSC